MEAALLSLIFTYSNYYGVDPYVALAIVRTESNFKSNAIGQHGEIGLFQLRPEYFKGYTKKDLFNPYTNVKLGIKHLASAKQRCSHQKDNSYVLCYNLGIGGAKKIKRPKQYIYYRKIMKNLLELQKGTEVGIKNLYDNRVDGTGVYLGECKDPYYQKHLRILNEYGQIMYIEKDRIFFLTKIK